MPSSKSEEVDVPPKERQSTIQKVRLGIDPQLCKTFNPEKHKWDRQWIVEPKFDGIRCIIVIEHIGKQQAVTAYSRNGKPLWNMNLILAELNRFDHPNLILDGEVYAKDWNTSIGIVKKQTPHPDLDQLRFHVWDCLTKREWLAGKSGVSNQVRKERLLPLFDHSTYSEIVIGRIVHNNEELQHAYTDFLTQGYEGAILKDPQGIYEKGRRSPYWLKIKPWHDADLTCTGSYPGEGKHLGRIGGLALEGVLEWKDKSYTVRTEVGTGFTDEERIFFQNLSDKDALVGRIIEIKFQEITVDGSCRFPVYHRLRTDK